MRCPRVIVHALFVAVLVSGCDDSPTAPSAVGPATSTLTYHVPAAAAHGETSATYTTQNATFSGSVRTTCVPNPAIAGSVCPDLMVMVDPFDETFCQLWAFAPEGERLGVGVYPNAQRSPRDGSAGLSFNCARGGTTCNWSVGRFTMHEIESDASGIVTRLHMTFEWTCADVVTLDTSGFGKGTGELWIVNGTT
jgi:hypothetical protein